MTGPSHAVLMIALGVSAMFAFYWVCMRFLVFPLKKKHTWSRQTVSAVSLVILYIPGLLLMQLFISALPIIPHSQQSFAAGDYVLVFLAQFFSVALMAGASAIENKLQGKDSGAMDDGAQYQAPYDYVHLLVLVPLMEEFLARRLLGERVTGMNFLFLSALIFSLIHLQTGKLAIPIGMFWNGFLWAWVYWASGSLLLSTLNHSLFNLLVTCLPEYLQRKHLPKALGLYMTTLIFAGIAGAVLLLINHARLLPAAGNSQLWPAVGAILGNPGTWVLIVVCIMSFFMGKSSRARDKAA